MNANKDVIVNREAFSPNALFFGRDNELEKLVATLYNDAGGTVLIAGDRGSGKTTLIKEAVKRLRKNKEGKLKDHFFKSQIRRLETKTIYVDVPLVPTGTQKTELRSQVLSLMVQTLNAHYQLLNRWEKLKMPLGYYKHLKQLYNLLTYKRRVEKKSFGFTAALRGQGGKVDRSIEQEIDITAIDIELFLKNFFIRFSDQLTFVIAFDELDKYATNGGGTDEVKPHDYIKELKNLFTLSKAKFIFTSTEEYYQTVDEKLKSNIAELDDYRYSLFTQKILINQLSPKAFEAYFKHLCILNPDKTDEVDRYEILMQSIMWLSNMYPFSAKKLITEFASNDDGDSHIDLIKAMEDLQKYGTNIASYHYVLNDVYRKRANTSDDYYNRYLYKALKKASNLFYSGSSIKLNRNNMMGILFADIEFINTSTKETYFITEFSLKREPETASYQGWETSIFDLNNVYITNINKAVSQLVYLLDKTLLIHAAIVPDQLSTIELVPTNESRPLDDIRSSLKKINKNIDEFAGTRDEFYQLYANRLKSYDPGLPRPILRTKTVDGKSAAGTDFSSTWLFDIDFRTDIDNLRKYNEQLEAALPEWLTNNITKHTNFTISVRDFSDWILEIGNYKAQILLNPTPHRIKSHLANAELNKIIAVNPEEKIHNPTKVKYFEYSDDWLDINNMLNEMYIYLDKNILSANQEEN